MSQCKSETDDKNDKHSGGLTEESNERAYHDDGAKETSHDDHRLEEGAAAVLARHLGIEVDGEFIVYGKLHQHPEGKSTGKEEAGKGTQQRQLSLGNGNEHDAKGQ